MGTLLSKCIRKRWNPRKSRAGRDRPFCHTQPPSLSLTALIHATAVTGLCANPAPTRHPAVLHPPQDLPPHFFRTFLKRCNSLYGLPLQTTLCKMVLPSTFRLLQKLPTSALLCPIQSRFTFRYLLTVCLPPLQK